MVAIARGRGVNARVSTFRRLRARNRYHGIWACASILHVPHAEIPIVLRLFARALVEGGALYVSLKRGHGEEVQDDGRFFSLFTQREFARYLTAECLFKVRKAWSQQSPDSAGRRVTWLNFIAVKAAPGGRSTLNHTRKTSNEPVVSLSNYRPLRLEVAFDSGS
jgi:hypothetical protein